MFETSQKIIKIGSSVGVILPAKELKQHGLKISDFVDLKVKPTKVPDSHTLEVVAIAQDLIKRHEQALKNLSQR